MTFLIFFSTIFLNSLKYSKASLFHLRKIHFKVCHSLKLIQELSVFIVAELVILLEIVIKRRMMKIGIDTRGIQGILLAKV